MTFRVKQQTVFITSLSIAIAVIMLIGNNNFVAYGANTNCDSNCSASSTYVAGTCDLGGLCWEACHTSNANCMLCCQTLCCPVETTTTSGGE